MTALALGTHGTMGISADRDIADSQTDEEGSFDEHCQGPAESFHTEPTVLIPGGTQLAPPNFESNALRAKGVNVNGRLPVEASRYKDIVAMDEAIGPTQLATQPVFDGRRAGMNSITADDESDIICILQPANPIAYDVADLVARVTPQHMLKYKQTNQDFNDDDLDYDTLDNTEAKSVKRSAKSDSKEIALRISSKVKDICMGFVFGRDPSKCDIMLVLPDEEKRVSGMHFRIFVNEGGIIMLEDTSTNGTLVEGKVLKCRDPHNHGTRQMHMIQKGTVIEIILGYGHTVKFNVTTPNRDRGLSAYQARLGEYLGVIKQANRNHAAADVQPFNPRAQLRLRLLPPTVERTDPGSPTTQSVATPPVTLLTAGSTPYTCGVHWNGGELYNVIEHIGKGAFADVFKFATKREGQLVAVKELEKRRFIKNGILDHKVTNELRIMQCLNHPHIIKYIDHREEPAYLFIVMEYVNHGDMLRYMNAYGKMDELQCRSIARQITHALKYLHNCGVTHRDIKPDNILISGLDPFFVKLSDFGLSKVIDNDDTFLKTFCGTLLYCAPEVYPEYSHYYKLGVQRRKRHRHGETTSKLSPYSSAVDIWSFAAVIFHLLCNKPPYKGSGENRGANMLRTIMENPLDISPLRQTGISRLGITFLEQMLRIDPTDRPNATECLRNPWIRDVADVALFDMDDDVPAQGLADIREVGEDIDASQLSLNDVPSDARPHVSDFDEDVSDVDEIDPERKSKRLRTQESYFEAQHNPCRDNHPIFTQRGSHDSDPRETLPSRLGSFAYQSLPTTDRINAMQATEIPPNRLFGEIGSSDLRSSGVLSHGAHAALQIVSPGNRDGEESYMYDEDEASEISSNFLHRDHLPYSTSIVHPAPRHPVGSAPSLLGAEAQIDHLNMASPESETSALTTPVTPRSRLASPASNSVTGSKRSSCAIEAGSKGSTPKRTRIIASRQLTPSMPTYWYDDDDPSTHNLEYASRVSGRDFIGENTTRLSKSRTSSLSEHKPSCKTQGEIRRHSSGLVHHPSDTQLPSNSLTMAHTRKTTAQLRDHMASNTKDARSCVESGRSRLGEEITVSSRSVASVPQSKAEIHSPTPSYLVTATSKSSFYGTSHTTARDVFVRPPPRAGRLVTLEGSFFSTSLNLDQRITSWGRDPATNTHVYPNSMDTRVPKAALDIIFWRSGIERELEHGADFREMPDVCALIQTRCSKSIKINEIHLTRAKGDGWTYGVLRQGDIITIFEGPTGFLKFRCEFDIGSSKEERAPGEVFVVEKEIEKFMQYMSGQTSPTNSEHVGAHDGRQLRSGAA